jgi:hypothetical protein
MAVILLRVRAVREGAKVVKTSDESLVTTKIYCPGWRTSADIALRVVGSGSERSLDVRRCDLLLDEETCDQACIEVEGLTTAKTGDLPQPS